MRQAPQEVRLKGPRTKIIEFQGRGFKQWTTWRKLCAEVKCSTTHPFRHHCRQIVDMFLAEQTRPERVGLIVDDWKASFPSHIEPLSVHISSKGATLQGASFDPDIGFANSTQVAAPASGEWDDALKVISVINFDDGQGTKEALPLHKVQMPSTEVDEVTFDYTNDVIVFGP